MGFNSGFKGLMKHEFYYYYYRYYYHYYLLKLSFHSVAVVLIVVQTKQIRINIHKRNNKKKTVQRIQCTENTSTQIFKKSSNIKFHENTSIGAELYLAGGRADGHEAISRFSQFCERA